MIEEALAIYEQSLVVARRVAEASTRGPAPALLPFPVGAKGTSTHTNPRHTQF